MNVNKNKVSSTIQHTPFGVYLVAYLNKREVVRFDVSRLSVKERGTIQKGIARVISNTLEVAS